MERTVFAIDVGTTKVCTLVAESHGQGALRITGVGVAPSVGMQKGTVVDVDATTQAIRASVSEAQHTSGAIIDRAIVGISGAHVAGVNSRGSTTVNHATRGVTQEDIARALEAAQVIAIPYSHELVHAIPRSYTIDGQDNIRNPNGMCGHKLEVEAHLVTAPTPAVNNLVKCVRAAGVEVECLVLQSLACGQAVLTQDERDSGVVLVDIGGGTTDVAIFIEGNVWHSAVIDKGGLQVMNDLVICLQMPPPAAEELKIRCGHANSAEISEGEMLEIVGFGENSRQEISRLLVAQIIEARMEQILSLVEKEIKCSGYSGLLPAGAVLCGGTAQLEGMRTLARRMLGMSVRVGAPHGIRGLVEVVSNPAYACSVGLLHWGLAYGGASRGRGEREVNWGSRLKELVSRLLPG